MLTWRLFLVEFFFGPFSRCDCVELGLQFHFANAVSRTSWGNFDKILERDQRFTLVFCDNMFGSSAFIDVCV